MTNRLNQPSVRVALASLVAAPAAFYIYFFFEWLFLVTSASPLAAMPLATQARSFLEATAHLLPAVVAVQLIASSVSLLHSKLRYVGVLPAAMILGLLGLMAFDNFTYTIFGFGIGKASPLLRPFYVGALLALIAAAAVKVERMVRNSETSPLAGFVGIVTICLLGAGGALAAIGHENAAVSSEKKQPNEWIDLGHKGESTVRPGMPNILLVGSDGVDATSMSAYGLERATTPFLAELRPQTLFVENAFSNVGKTRGALVTMLTGRLPTATKVFFPPHGLQGEEAHWHLPGILKEHGYTTLQLGMRHYADSEDANLLGAFDAANYRWESTTPTAARAATTEGDLLRTSILERIEERLLHLLQIREMVDGFAHIQGEVEDPMWKDERRMQTLLRYFKEAPEPWFVHVHMLDTHPPRDYEAGLDPRRREKMVSEMDERLRRLVEALTENVQIDRTVLVLTSDHTSDWGTTGRIPLLFRFPGAEPRGTVEVNAQLADIAPTLLDYIGVARPGWMDGSSLLRADDLALNRPIFGISRLSRARNTITPFFREIKDGGPPNYGAIAASLIAGSRWYEIQLSGGKLRSGAVEGHTRPDLELIDDARARDLLMKHLATAGFEVSLAPPQKPPQKTELASRDPRAEGD